MVRDRVKEYRNAIPPNLTSFFMVKSYDYNVQQTLVSFQITVSHVYLSLSLCIQLSKLQ